MTMNLGRAFRVALLRHRVALGVLLSIVALAVIANVPVTTKQGLNFEVSTHRLPLYVKTFEFFDRDAQYRQLADEITRGLASEQERVMAVFNWTTRRIQPTPEGWPIVDDHILNIIIRGCGLGDQRADVFATLATYAGMPAFWQSVKAPSTRQGVILTFARVTGRWVVVDVANSFAFRNASGQLATAEELSANPEILKSVAGSLIVGTTPYAMFFEGIRTPRIPSPLRAELQMPSRRLWHEARIALRLEHDHEP